MGAVANDTVVTIRSAAVLTDAYVASDAFSLNGAQQGFDLQLSITKSSFTSLEFTLEASNDGGTTWFTPMSEAVSAGVATLTKKSWTVAAATLATTDTIILAFNRMSYPKYRFNFKATGTVTNTSLAAVVRKTAAAR